MAIQRGYAALRIAGQIFRSELFVIALRDAFIGDALQRRNDADPVGGGRAPVGHQRERPAMASSAGRIGVFTALGPSLVNSRISSLVGSYLGQAGRPCPLGSLVRAKAARIGIVAACTSSLGVAGQVAGFMVRKTYCRSEACGASKRADAKNK